MSRFFLSFIYIQNLIGILAFSLLTFPLPAISSSESQNFLLKAQQLQLDIHPTWLKLLYVPELGRQSEVVSPEYFLSEVGRSDSSKELYATLSAYFQPWPDNPNRHPVCQFPGRYYWLHKQLNLPLKSEYDQRCEHLTQWGLHNNTQSISFVLVSGFLGNPASSFGHALMRLNTKTSAGSKHLFDKTINYGADIPPGDSTLRYVYQGIFGGYKAMFTNQYFSVQDKVYSRTEFRDMWDYELNLSQDEVRFLLLHIWEITGREFEYYFFEKNCAYRISQLVELVKPVELIKHGYRPWYLPEMLFQNLEQVNKSISQNNGNEVAELIKSVEFIPSSQRELYKQMELLDEYEIRVIRQILESQAMDQLAWESLSTLSLDRQILLLDTLLSYQYYLLIANGNQENSFMTTLKQKALLARLSLSAAKKVKNLSVNLNSPANGNKGTMFGLGAYRNELNENGILVNLAAYRRDQLGRNSLEGNELILLDALFYNDDSGVQLESFDLVRISNLKPQSFSLAQDRSWAWQIAMGADRLGDGSKYQIFVESGVGQSFSITDSLFSYLLLTPNIFSSKNYFSGGGKVGFLYQSPKLMGSAYAQTLWDIEGNNNQILELRLSTPFNASTNVFFEARNEFHNKYAVGLQYYF